MCTQSKEKKLITFQHTELAAKVQSGVWYKKQLFFKHINLINILCQT